MWSYGKDRDQMSERERYLEGELEDYREKERRAEDERMRRWRERNEQSKAEREERLRSAEGWPEALRKQIVLYGREVIGAVDELDQFWSHSQEACAKALELWEAVEAEKKGEIEELERRIEGIRAEVKEEVARRLEGLGEGKEFEALARELRANTPEGFLNW